MAGLSEPVLLHIANFISREDIVHLSMTCQRLKNVLPTFSLIRGPDLNERGPPSGGSFIPSIYFDGPGLNSPVEKLIVSMSWSDQVSY